MHPQAFCSFLQTDLRVSDFGHEWLGGILLTSTPSELGKHPDGKDPKVWYQSPPILVKFSKGQWGGRGGGGGGGGEAFTCSFGRNFRGWCLRVIVGMGTNDTHRKPMLRVNASSLGDVETNVVGVGCPVQRHAHCCCCHSPSLVTQQALLSIPSRTTTTTTTTTAAAPATGSSLPATSPSLSQQHSFPLHLIRPYTLERADERVVDQSLDDETDTRQYIDAGIRAVTGSPRRGDWHQAVYGRRG